MNYKISAPFSFLIFLRMSRFLSPRGPRQPLPGKPVCLSCIWAVTIYGGKRMKAVLVCRYKQYRYLWHMSGNDDLICLGIRDKNSLETSSANLREKGVVIKDKNTETQKLGAFIYGVYVPNGSVSLCLLCSNAECVRAACCHASWADCSGSCSGTFRVLG